MRGNNGGPKSASKGFKHDRWNGMVHTAIDMGGQTRDFALLANGIRSAFIRQDLDFHYHEKTPEEAMRTATRDVDNLLYEYLDNLLEYRNFYEISRIAKKNPIRMVLMNRPEEYQVKKSIYEQMELYCLSELNNNDLSIEASSVAGKFLGRLCGIVTSAIDEMERNKGGNDDAND